MDSRFRSGLARGRRRDGAQAQQPEMSFFVTSTGLGQGGNLGGIKGADAHCQALARGAGAGSKTWRAYLSVTDLNGKGAINARDRIGRGPWHNANGVRIAIDVDDLAFRQREHHRRHGDHRERRRSYRPSRTNTTF